jgi:hypothetical protein
LRFAHWQNLPVPPKNAGIFPIATLPRADGFNGKREQIV